MANLNPSGQSLGSYSIRASCVSTDAGVPCPAAYPGWGPCGEDVGAGTCAAMLPMVGCA